MVMKMEMKNNNNNNHMGIKMGEKGEKMIFREYFPGINVLYLQVEKG